MKSVGFRTCTFISFFIFFRLKYKPLMLKVIVSVVRSFLKRNFCLSVIFLCLVFHSTECLCNDLLSLYLH